MTESTVVAFKTANKMPAYKLMYFEAKGRAEVVRLAFTIAEQMFEDKRFSIEEWYTVKPSTYTFLFSQVKLMQIILKIQYCKTRKFGAYVFSANASAYTSAQINLSAHTFLKRKNYFHQRLDLILCSLKQVNIFDLIANSRTQIKI